MPRTVAADRHTVEYRGAVLNDGPIAYWRLDEASGNITDLARQIVGTKGGTPTYSQAGAIFGET